MSLKSMCVWSLVLYLVHAENDSIVSSTLCTSSFRYADSDQVINVHDSCRETPCIAKCCPENQILFKNETSACVENKELILKYNLTNLDNYSDVKIYEKDIGGNIIEAAMKMEQFRRIYSDTFLGSDCSYDAELLLAASKNSLVYIMKDGSLGLSMPNRVNGWNTIETGLFCVELQVELSADGTDSTHPQLQIKIFAFNGNNSDSDERTNKKNTLTAYGMLVSCFFLVLVLGVYVALPQLRNLAGIMLMAYAATLTTAFILRAVQVIGSNIQLLDPTVCLCVGFTLYYMILASFTWMNVMSFDIWWTMRGFRKLRQIHRRGILVKFGWYSLYGWGVPLVPVVFIVIIEHIDLTHLPQFITPHFIYGHGNRCFIEEKERQLYMNGPILITTCINIILFLMTAYNIWCIKKAVAQHSAGNSRRNKKDEARFCIYLKLSLVMGINWILEVLSSVYNTDSVWWYIPDIFNSLVGFFIFIIFVCKRNVIALLRKRLSNRNESTRKPDDSSHTESSQLRGRKRTQDSATTDGSDVDECDIRNAQLQIL